MSLPMAAVHSHSILLTTACSNLCNSCLSLLTKKFHFLLFISCTIFASATKNLWSLLLKANRLLISHLHPFWILLFYFLSNTILGFFLLRILGPKQGGGGGDGPGDLDLFFMAASATTVSSMSTVEMEALSNSQLVVMALLMLVGGEVFTSILQLHLLKTKLEEEEHDNINVVDVEVVEKKTSSGNGNISFFEIHLTDNNISNDRGGGEGLKQRSINLLALVILAYLAVAHLLGSISIIVYLSLVPSARQVLTRKGINTLLFSTFLTISTLANGGFVPTNENMMPFKNNSGLLLLLAPLVLAGNTLFPPCLRLALWAWRRLGGSRGGKGGGRELEYLVNNGEEIGFHHLVPRKHSIHLVYTALGFVGVQVLFFCCLEWSSEVLDGMSSYRKIVAAVSQSVNSRHAGESPFDLSAISPAIVVLYVAMMYLPPYTMFLPVNDVSSKTKKKQGEEEKTQTLGLRRSLVLSQLSYLVIFVILVCITERKKLADDPLNFNILSITTEVISSYGNVGFSTGYACARQLRPADGCKDMWYGFAGRWSTKGKLILIVVMFFGRMKKFNMKGGKAWKLS